MKSMPVPTTAEMVALSRCTPLPDGATHNSSVEAVQAAVVQSDDPMQTVGEGAREPKLKPATDTVVAIGAFAGLVEVKTGAAQNAMYKLHLRSLLTRHRALQQHACESAPSKLNASPPAPVPTSALNVATVRLAPPPYDSTEHVSVVEDVHDVLMQLMDSSSEVVALTSFETKSSPEIVTDALAVPAKFPPVEKPLVLRTGATRQRHSTKVHRRTRAHSTVHFSASARMRTIEAEAEPSGERPHYSGYCHNSPLRAAAIRRRQACGRCRRRPRCAAAADEQLERCRGTRLNRVEAQTGDRHNSATGLRYVIGAG